MTSTGFPCQQEFHASCIESTSCDASKMAALLNSLARPRKTLMQQREHGRHQTHCEKSRHVQHFAPSFQATFQRKSSTRDKSQAWQSERSRTVWRKLACHLRHEFASGWSWNRAYFSSSSMLHAKIWIIQGFSNFWQSGSTLPIKYISCLLSVYSNKVNYLEICITFWLFIAALVRSVPKTSTYNTHLVQADIISRPTLNFEFELLIFGLNLFDSNDQTV